MRQAKALLGIGETLLRPPHEGEHAAPDGASALGVSVDGTWSHADFARAVSVPFPLLADDDPPGGVARAYGLFVPETGRSRRALIVIDRNGAVAWCATFPDEVNPGVDGVLSALETIAEANRSAVAS